MQYLMSRQFSSGVVLDLLSFRFAQKDLYDLVLPEDCIVLSRIFDHFYFYMDQLQPFSVRHVILTEEFSPRQKRRKPNQKRIMLIAVSSEANDLLSAMLFTGQTPPLCRLSLLNPAKNLRSRKADPVLSNEPETRIFG